MRFVRESAGIDTPSFTKDTPIEPPQPPGLSLVSWLSGSAGLSSVELASQNSLSRRNLVQDSPAIGRTDVKISIPLWRPNHSVYLTQLGILARWARGLVRPNSSSIRIGSQHFSNHTRPISAEAIPVGVHHTNMPVCHNNHASLAVQGGHPRNPRHVHQFRDNVRKRILLHNGLKAAYVQKRNRPHQSYEVFRRKKLLW